MKMMWRRSWWRRRRRRKVTCQIWGRL
uniref:Uncharacterized protein n=1 Tax=Anguilla anguilla TaxID=7936 RepID=A0A0E9VM81_ANGAN